jgi:AAA+ ATPase superfamily predicted ATPase
MKSFKVTPNKHFVGRKAELERLAKIRKSETGNLIVVYGRRRVGKTELIEQFFCNDLILKFEGLQTGNLRSAGARQYQIDNCLHRLAQYAENPMLEKIRCQTWTDFFGQLDEVLGKKPVVLFFEEVQWLSNYQTEFLSEMKPFWDDRWRHRRGLSVVICGSSPSFIMNQFLGDKALYSRAQHEFHLRPFSILETSAFLAPAGRRETMIAQLLLGGIPGYLERIRTGSSTLLGIIENSFLPDAYFATEARRIFVSSMSTRKQYQSIIAYLARVKAADRHEIQKSLDIESGGTLSAMLEDLLTCGFIEKYSPLDKKTSSLIARYTIADEYLRFFFKFIDPLASEISQGRFVRDPAKALPASNLAVYLGLCFERWCRSNAYLFARILGFDRIDYQSGSYFGRASDSIERGFQIDLMFIRADHKIVFCEVKYSCLSIANMRTAHTELSRKRDIFMETAPRYKNYSYDMVLITMETADWKDASHEFFSDVVTFDEIFDEKYW